MFSFKTIYLECHKTEFPLRTYEMFHKTNVFFVQGLDSLLNTAEILYY